VSNDYGLGLNEVASNLGFPEGPVALPDGSIVLVEIARGFLTRIYPDGKKHVVAELKGGPNGAAIGPDGACYVCNHGGSAWSHDPRQGWLPQGISPDYKTGSIQRVDLASGKFETLYTSCGDVQLSRPNDIVFDREGGFYFTDFGAITSRTMVRGTVYYANRDGTSIKEVIYPISKPNGIGLSPDEKTLYVSETETARLWKFRVLSPGKLEKVPDTPSGGSLVVGLPGFQNFDSLAVEADGRICVATLVLGGITITTPDGSAVVFAPFPDYYVTNICLAAATSAQLTYVFRQQVV